MSTRTHAKARKTPGQATARTAASVSASSPAVRVTIVGGGCAGLSTAWQLLKLNEERAKLLDSDNPRERRTAQEWPEYAITVYESSWHLGGKGASRRDEHGRILEHGLHVWLGFYENAFKLMRECYAQVEGEGWGPDAPAGQRLTHGRFDDAFAPEPHIGVASRHGGAWETWTGFLPPMKGQPGERLDTATNPFSMWGYLARALALAKALMQSVLAPSHTDPHSERSGPRARSALDEAVELDFSFDPSSSPEVLVERFAVLARAVLLTSAAGVLQAASFLESWLRENNPAPQIASSMLKFIEALATNVRRQLQDLVMVDEELRRKTEILNLLMTILIGLYRDRVFFDARGLDAIDGIDYRDWLQKHGATTGAVDSPLVWGIYDLVFAYRDGDHRKPSLSAAQALRGAARMFFTYRGSMFWRLQSGMGDAVFAPLYRALKKRGVEFKFLHRLVDIEFDFRQRQPSITKLRFETDRDVALLNEPDRSPLDEQGCWPEDASKCFGPEGAGKSKAGKARSKRQFDATAGVDFEVAVIAVGKDDFVAACEAARDDTARSYLFKELPAWELMRQRVATVGTRSAQVWMSHDVEALGWDRGPVIVAGLDVPHRDDKKKGSRRYETWADMTHTLAAERAYRVRQDGAVHGADVIRSISYFCGVLPDDKLRKTLERTDDAHGELGAFLKERMRTLWPKAFTGGRTPLELLVAANGKEKGAGYLRDQYVVDNRVGSARYTQSLPGSGTVRISPLDPWFANMTVAGDWTDCGFNGGCVEAAVMSGRLAAHAISGRVDLNQIVGYHHP
ncbi:NAD(P)-binding protein [Variovorax sp. J22R24]|uniref:FAD-dependent oxidoreductase n=1 Tax=Variovorax gracilis TaxID=3053502 RepID=UPI002576999C|nr:NAD(P)-binding protein [Variovorax sp. J22R24]MDM0105035.1 NAD(P)-binding protein [Variovorax sp. J22R24]